MLSDQEKQEILALAGHYDLARAAAIEALQIVQRRDGWVSDQHLQEIGELLQLTAAEMDNVATFYSLIFRKPVGRHVVLLCDSISCWVMGCTQLAAHFKARFGVGFGETTADGRFTLLPIACLGTCDRAPALIVDRDTYGMVTIEELDRILEEYR